MFKLIGVNTDKVYCQNEYREELFKFMEREWPTSSISKNGKTKMRGQAALQDRMPEPMMIVRKNNE